MELNIPIGEISALATAATWACSAMIWKRIGHFARPSVINLLKDVMSLPFLGIVAWGFGGGGEVLVPMALLLIAASGMLGIGLGDTFYIDAIRRLGALRALLLTMLAPPLAVVMGWVFLGERMTVLMWLGLALTLTGVSWVITRDPPGRPRVRGREVVTEPGRGLVVNVPVGLPPSLDRRSLLIGGVAGVLGAASQGMSLVINRVAYNYGEVDPLLATLVRIAGGVALLAALIPLIPRPDYARSVWTWDRRTWSWFALAAVVGTAGGFTLMQFAVDKGHHTGVIQTLLSTSPLFVIPMAALAGERITRSLVGGVVVAAIGIALLFAGG